MPEAKPTRGSRLFAGWCEGRRERVAVNVLRVSVATVHRWCRGEARPDWDMAVKIEEETMGVVPRAAWAYPEEEQRGKD